MLYNECEHFNMIINDIIILYPDAVLTVIYGVFRFNEIISEFEYKKQTQKRSIQKKKNVIAFYCTVVALIVISHIIIIL